MELDGRPIRATTPRDAIRAGICLLTEDRKSQGLVLGQTVQENFGLPNLRQFSQGGLIDRQAESDAFANYVSQMQIKIANHEQPARTLSGGNQQKVVLAKWLQRNADVIILTNRRAASMSAPNTRFISSSINWQMTAKPSS